MSEHELKFAAAKTILQNQEHHRIPHSVMESIVPRKNSLFQTASSEVQHQVICQKQAWTQISVLLSTIFDGEAQYTSVFKGLPTTYHQNMFIKENFRCVVCHITNTNTCTTTIGYHHLIFPSLQETVQKLLEVVHSL